MFLRLFLLLYSIQYLLDFLVIYNNRMLTEVASLVGMHAALGTQASFLPPIDVSRP